MRKDERLHVGSAIVTGPGSSVRLRFDDGQAIVLNENSEFRITGYSFAKDDSKQDSSVFDLFKGALRSVSSLHAQRSPQAYVLRVPQAAISVRGTEFMVAVVNPAYVRVLSGTIGVSNAAGAVTFTAGSTATVASATALPTAIATATLPASVAASFDKLNMIAVGPGADPAGPGITPAQGIAAGMAVVVGVVVAVEAAGGGITLGAISPAAAIGAGITVMVVPDNSATLTVGTTGTR